MNQVIGYALNIAILYEVDPIRPIFKISKMDLDPAPDPLGLKQRGDSARTTGICVVTTKWED